MKPTIRKGMLDIKTMTSLQTFRTRSSSGAMAELTALSVVKERLKAEIEKLNSRYNTLNGLVKRIEEKEKFLYRFVDSAKGDISPGAVESLGNGPLMEENQKNSAPPANLNEIVIKY